MILSFMTTWPEAMQEVGGQATDFVCLIWAGLDIPLRKEILKHWEFTDQEITRISTFRITGRAKIHTIRKDPTRRWKTGNKVHFCTGVRTKKYRRFAPINTVLSVQKIRINHIIVNGDDDYFEVFIDDKLLPWDQVERLAKNDGFNSVSDFFDYFSDLPFEGVLIHWTDLNY